MQFKPEMCQSILDGTKTQTRRLVKPREVSRDGYKTVAKSWAHVVLGITGYRTWVPYYPKWQVGRTYAVQPGRGRKAIGRIRITAIRREHLQDMSANDAITEGLMPGGLYGQTCALTRFTLLWDSIYTKLGTRWQDNPEVWVLEFEVSNDQQDHP